MTRMTKAQLVDENVRLRAQCDLLELKVERLKTELREFENYAPVQEYAPGCEPLSHEQYERQLEARRPAPAPIRTQNPVVGYYTRRDGVRMVKLRLNPRSNVITHRVAQ